MNLYSKKDVLHSADSLDFTSSKVSETSKIFGGTDVATQSTGGRCDTHHDTNDDGCYSVGETVDYHDCC